MITMVILIMTTAMKILIVATECDDDNGDYDDDTNNYDDDDNGDGEHIDVNEIDDDD